MDQNLQLVMERRLERTAKALEKNGFAACVLPTRQALLEKLKELIPQGASCSAGGSVTLRETGVLDFLKQGDYRYLDRYAPDADVNQVFHEALNCDMYFMSSNAITDNGELYNIDGNGNRVAALIFGPERVVVVAGYNKIVPDLDAARERNRLICAPANALRLNREDLPCFHTGVCADCNSPGRFCAQEVVSYRSLVKGRIIVLLVNEALGY